MLQKHPKIPKCIHGCVLENKGLEARGGIEPPIKVLQTYALPLGDRADCLWQMRIITSEARDNVSKIRTMLSGKHTGCAEPECRTGTEA
jgi:hypothetical protein